MAPVQVNITDNKVSIFWSVVTFIFIALGVFGIFLPLLPTTPFLLVAAWSAPKASPRIESWMYNHPTIGPPLHAWKDQRAVSLRSKLSALMLMLLSWFSIFYFNGKPFVLIFLAVLFTGVLLFLFSLPSPTISYEED